jgi:hypothetical protein
METSSGYAIGNQNAMHFLTFAVINWDGPTIRDIFSRKIYRDIVIESLKFCQNQKESILDIIAPPILNPLAKNGNDIDMVLW